MSTDLRKMFEEWREQIDIPEPEPLWDTGLISWGEYTDFTESGAFYPGANTGNKDEMSYLMCSLGGEIGETLNAYKKILRDDTGVKGKSFDQALSDKTPKLMDELGDVFWYIAQILNALELPLEAILIYNTVKLCERHNQPWPYENLLYSDALKLMQHIESLITSPNASISMDTDTSSKP